jgi:hypothetical protein
MANNVTLPGTGQVVATTQVGTVHHQLVKPTFGGDGVGTMVSATTPMPVSEPEQTFTNIADQPVGAASAELFAAAAAARTAWVVVPPDADTGIRIAFGAAAGATSFLLPKGFAGKFRTRQAINAIRAGAVDVSVSKSTSVDS